MRYVIKAHGTKGIVDALFPLLDGLTRGEFTEIQPGVELQIPPDTEIVVSGSGDGKLIVTPSQPFKIRVDVKTLVCRNKITEKLTGGTVTQEGVDLKVPGVPVRPYLEFTE